MEKTYTVIEAAALLRVSTSFLAKRMVDGTLRRTKRGKFNMLAESELFKLVSEIRRPPVSVHTDANEADTTARRFPQAANS